MVGVPILNVRVEFHFVEQQETINGQLVDVNFQCSDPNADYYAPDYVEAILNGANAVLMDPELSNKATSNIDLGDTRIRVRLFGNPSDLCDAIFIHETQPSIFSNPDAIAIVVKNTDQSGFSGVLNTNSITLANIHEAVFELGNTPQQVVGAGPVLLHEIGHYAGLCHSFSEDNTCPDLDPIAECSNNPNANLGDCGSNNAECPFGHSNNLMSYGPQNALTMSQWIKFYYNLSFDEVVTTEYAVGEACVSPPPSSPLIIPANTTVTWDSPKYIAQNVEVRSGAALLINCNVIMAKGLRIIVNRGGRLFVNGGSIYGEGPDCRWGGILVHGKANVEQPAISNAQNTNYQLTSNDPGVVWLKDAELHWADIAISTKGSGSFNTFEYFGGLVMADNSDFIDNGRAIEFMKYDWSNKSYLNGCLIESSKTSPELSRWGVTIWACRDITFTDVYFTGLTEWGIQGINFNANIQLCEFDGINANFGTAIRSESTMPNSVVKSTVIDDCMFKNYNQGIVGLSSSSFINGFEITNNTFEKPVGSYSTGVQLRGESVYHISKQNYFNQMFASTWIQATGERRNTIECNDYGPASYSSVLVHGRNDRLTILGNEFPDNSAVRQIFVNGGPAAFATIAEQQGSPAGAGNCFANPISAIVANANYTRKFEYYVYNLDTNPIDCELPTNNLSDTGVNNYYIRKANASRPDCGTPQSQSYTNNDLVSARLTTSLKKTAYNADPSSKTKRNDYFSAADRQDSILMYLVSEAASQDNLDKVDSLLLGENSDVYTRGVIGLRTQRGDVPGARSLLNTLPTITQDDLWFYEIMQINFSLVEADTLYRLTPQETSRMLTIADTDSSIMSGYACALLNLCADFKCDFRLPDPGSGLSIKVADASVIESDFTIFPNPTNGTIEVITNKPTIEPITIEISDINGRILLSQRLEIFSSGSEEVLIKETGVFILRIFSSTSQLHVQKLVVVQ